MSAGNFTLADNPATQALAFEVFVLRALVEAMTTTAHAREAEITRLELLLDERRTEVAA